MIRSFLVHKSFPNRLEYCVAGTDHGLYLITVYPANTIQSCLSWCVLLSSPNTPGRVLPMGGNDEVGVSIAQSLKARLDQALPNHPPGSHEVFFAHDSCRN